MTFKSLYSLSITYYAIIVFTIDLLWHTRTRYGTTFLYTTMFILYMEYQSSRFYCILDFRELYEGFDGIFKRIIESIMM